MAIVKKDTHHLSRDKNATTSATTTTTTAYNWERAHDSNSIGDKSDDYVSTSTTNTHIPKWMKWIKKKPKQSAQHNKIMKTNQTRILSTSKFLCLHYEPIFDYTNSDMKSMLTLTKFWRKKWIKLLHFFVQNKQFKRRINSKQHSGAYMPPNVRRWFRGARNTTSKYDA